MFDQDTVEGWVVLSWNRSGRYRSWMSYIRDFGRWLPMNGTPDAYVLSDRWKAPFVPAHPYLLSRREIELFFDAAAQIRTPCPWRWQAVAFFTLMHSCGLRTGEARALQTGHVDLDGGHIDIMWSKGNRSRRLPLTGRGHRRSSTPAIGHRERSSARVRRFSSPPPATRSARRRSGRYSAASGTRPDWRGRRAANSRGHTTSGTTSPTPTSNDG